MERKSRLCFDDDHGEGAPHFVEAADVPGDGLLDLLHCVRFDAGDDVVDAVHDVDFFDVRDFSELLEEIFLSPKVSIDKYETLVAWPLITFYWHCCCSVLY